MCEFLKLSFTTLRSNYYKVHMIVTILFRNNVTEVEKH